MEKHIFMMTRTKTIFILSLILFTFLSVDYLAEGSDKSVEPSAPHYVVVSVVNGNTLKLSNNQSVRLIGVDAPDPATVPGQRAVEFVKGLVEKKVIELSGEESAGRNLIYARILAPRAGPLPGVNDAVRQSAPYKQGLLNGIIIFAGFGRVDTSHPFRYAKEFTDYERQARAAGRGLWSEPPKMPEH
jgi:endonuclease YncB( thermonuclease family)